MIPHSDTGTRVAADPAMQAIAADLMKPRSDSGTHAAVREYLDRGWVVFPVPRGTKETRAHDWANPSRRWTIEHFRSDDNVALRLDTLIDIEPDTLIARKVCKSILPQTASYGRPSGGVPTHYLFELADDAHEKLKTFTLDGKELIGVRRGCGEYSLAPPSCYRAEPEKNKPADTLTWMSSSRTPMRISSENLLRTARMAATIAALAHKWTAGSRHNMAAYAAGLLCRLLPKDDERWQEAVLGIIEHVATLAGDEQVADRVRYARSTIERFAKGLPVKGGPSLHALLGGDLVAQLYRWWDDSGQIERVDTLNAKHAVLFGQHGKVVILTEESEDGELQLRFSEPGTMSLLYPEPVKVGKKQVTLGDWWVRHPHRRFYRGIELAPNGDGNPGYYNMWHGWTVEPKKGDWSLYREHLKLVAGDDEGAARYILAWMAETVQHPERPIGIVLAFKGEQGTGKSTFAKWFGRLFGPHFIHLDSEHHLLGNFNAHLHNKIFVLADEAVWAGSKAGLGALKRLITEDTLNIERKHVDVISVKNLIHMMVASNENWVVPATFDNRRFAVFNVSNRRKDDHRYFGAIAKQLFEDGGLAALLYDLLEHKSDIDVRVIPETQALTEQKILSAKPIEKWWIEKLHEGVLTSDADSWQEGKDHHVEKSTLQMDYESFVTNYTTSRWDAKATKTQLGMFLSKQTPVGVHKNLIYYIVPSLDKCRADWISRHRWASDYKWDGDQPDAAEPEAPMDWEFPGGSTRF